MKPYRVTFYAWLILFCFAQTAFSADRFVSALGSHQPPFSSWTDAATNIQAAIDAAAAGETIWVTNGVYATGGKVMAGDLTNRIALTKALTVRSVNGPASTIIQGAWDGNTNGPLAVRCAWLTNGAVLNGFTLQGGATRTGGGSALQSGGGVWGVSTQAQVISCYIFTNAASHGGGGSFQVALSRCKVVGNRSFGNGGGSAFGSFNSTLFTQNVASSHGGGVYGGEVNNCTIVDNNASMGGGMHAVTSPPRNTIIAWNNFFSPFFGANYHGPFVGNPAYCYIYNSSGTAHPGTGNINASPQFTDDLHQAVTSPCRGTGSSLYASETDFDGEPWRNPPSIGCDEVYEEAINGPLSVRLDKQWDEVAENQFLYLFSTVTGRVTRATWSFGDGSVLTNMTAMSLGRRWTNAGDYTVTFTAYNSDNTNGVSANTIVHVVPLIAPVVSEYNLHETNFTLRFPAQPNVSYDVERATNLTPPVVWRTVNIVSSTNNFVEVTDSKATNAAQFYRVRVR